MKLLLITKREKLLVENILFIIKSIKLIGNSNQKSKNKIYPL
jgi:hypothetical protein